MRATLAGLYLIISFSAIQAQPSNVRWEYIQRFNKIAIDEMKRTGIPASIKLAQGLLESGGGTSVLARKANNHFGVKCGSEWRGATYYVKDDDYDENGQLIESCFRAYEDAESSYIAHSEFLRDPNKAYRYGFLFRLDQKDYKKWAQGLKSAGYATSPTYADNLINIIDQYKLYKYDGGDVEFDLVRVINDVKVTLAKEGQTPEELAKKYNLKTKCLLKYNERLRGPNQPLKEGEYIYLQRKRWFFRGKQEFHFVKEGEDMYKISQLYGLKEGRLYRKNRMDKGTEPAVGQKIRLRGKVKKGQTPKLRTVDINEETNNNENDFPTDDGSGKVLDIDPTVIVKPNDLPNSNGNPNTNPTNNGNNNGNNNGAATTKPDVKPTTGTTTGTGTKPTTGTGTTTTTTKPTTGTTTGTGTKPTTTSGTGTTTTKPKVKPSTGTTTPNTNVPPKPKPEPTTPTTGVKHVVKAGDTLYSLSRQYGVTVDQIKTLNNMTDSKIKLGQELIIKK
ncbi:MAG: glucosaminidase domain-containing protein [Bacteroidia bacterium]